MLLSIVIPVYNEAESLPRMFQALTQVLPQIDADYELLFVNDGSNG
jgi:glycosyltransferase involved in cell wall biosynthesis